MDYRKLTSPCGLDCFNCIVYLAKDNPEIRKGFAQQLNVPEDQAYCKGCRGEGGCIRLFGAKEPCKVWKCVHEKGHEFCFECDEFPCMHLSPMSDMADQRPHNMKVMNLCVMKREGVEAWAEKHSQAIRQHYFTHTFDVLD